MTRPGRVAERQEAFIEDLEFMLATNRGCAEICQRLGVSWDALTRSLYRWGRNDLANRFSGGGTTAAGERSASPNERSQLA